MTARASDPTPSHNSNLRHFCRICGEKKAIPKDRRKPVEKETLKDIIIEALNIDVEKEDASLYPPYICSGCKRKLERWNEAKQRQKKKDYPPPRNISLATFTSHSEECHICEECVTEETCASQLQSMAKEIGERHEFASWKGENNQIIFLTLDTKTLCANRALVLHENGSWYIELYGVTVRRPSHLPEILSAEHLEEVFVYLNKPGCVGNPHFENLNVAGRVFNDRQGSAVATVTDKHTVYHMGKMYSQTIRHLKCKGLATNGDKCEVCYRYRDDLSARASDPSTKKKKFSGNPSSHARHDLMPPSALAEKIQTLQSEKHKLQRKVQTLEEKVARTIAEDSVTIEDQSVNEQLTNILSEKAILMDNILKEGTPQKLLWEEQKKYLSLSDPRRMRWHPAIIRWCIALYEKSPVAYKTLRKSQFIQLPHHSTLFAYTHFTETMTGINPDVIERIVAECNLENAPNRERNVSIIFDEMKTKSGLVYSERTGQITGFVDMGTINEECAKFERQLLGQEDPPLATHVLVLMVRGIFSSLKTPIGYWPCTGASSHQLFHVISEAVQTLECAGFLVRAFVSDGASPNRKFYQLHQDKDQDQVTYCTPNPVDPSRNIYFICDVPHLIKTTRNCWENSGWNSKSRNLIYQGKPILWTHLLDLYEWDSGIGKATPGLRFLHKLTPEHVHLSPSHRMRVYLAAQVLSKSVAHALAIQGKEDRASTIKFVSYIDTFFDCLNVSNRVDGIFKSKGALAPYTSMDDPRFKWLTVDFLGFLDEWQKEGDAQPNLTKDEKKRLCLSPQTLEGLRITVYSIVELSQTLLSLGDVDYLLTEKFSQDPLEEYFSKQRAAGGSNTNPDMTQFANSFNSLIVSGSASVRATCGNCRNKGREEDGQHFLNEDPLPRKSRRSNDHLH